MTNLALKRITGVRVINDSFELLIETDSCNFKVSVPEGKNPVTLTKKLMGKKPLVVLKENRPQEIRVEGYCLKLTAQNHELLDLIGFYLEEGLDNLSDGWRKKLLA